MSKPNFFFENLLSTNSGEADYDEHKKRINEVIEAFNSWQIDSDFDERTGQIVIARIEAIRRLPMDPGDFGSEYESLQAEILERMTKHINKVLRNDGFDAWDDY